MSEVPGMESCQLIRGTKTGAWITVLSYTVNGTDFGNQELQDALFLRYGIDIQDLFTHSD